MVRTAANAQRVAGGKSTRKGANVAVRQESTRSRSPSNGPTDRGAGGLNPICPRETPSWQKPITRFFTQAEKCQSNSSINETDQEPTTSTYIPEDINMPEADKENITDEIMETEDKENTPKDIKIDNDCNLSTNIECKRSSVSTNRKSYRDEEDGEMGPRKKIKLDENMFKHLQSVENA